MPGIVLDTNVASALFREQEDQNVKRWFLAQELENLYLTSINLAEILFGIRRLTPGKRRAALEQWLHQDIYPNFAQRILPFDQAAAETWSSLHAADLAAGRQRPLADSYIGAIAITHGFSIASRNQRDFERLDLAVINPFLPN